VDDWKSAVVKIPFGGAKGGSNVIQGDVTSRNRAFDKKIYLGDLHDAGSEQDIPARMSIPTTGDGLDHGYI